MSIATKIEVILVEIKCQKHFAKDVVGRDFFTSFQFDVTDRRFDIIDIGFNWKLWNPFLENLSIQESERKFPNTNQNKTY